MDKLKQVVFNVAPLLASSLDGPMAGVTFQWIATAFDAPSVMNPDDLAVQLSSDPEAVVKLQQIEQAHRLELDYLSQISKPLCPADMEVKAYGTFHSYVPHILALLYLGIYAGIQFHCIAHAGNEDDVISARCQDIMVMIASFYFGAMFKKA